MNKICLYGASGHGKVVLDIANSCNAEIEVFFDDNPKQEYLNSILILKSIELKNYKIQKFIISIGNNRLRKEISGEIKNPFATLIHEKSIISSSVDIKDGTVIMANVVINAYVRIGKHNIINTAAVIEHECIIGNYVHISPNATITGNVEIGEGTHVGAGAIIIPNIIIGKWVTIGAGTVVTKNIPDYAVVVGNPCRIIKYNENEG